jgi:hypothetical protein
VKGCFGGGEALVDVGRVVDRHVCPVVQYGTRCHVRVKNLVSEIAKNRLARGSFASERADSERSC